MLKLFEDDLHAFDARCWKVHVSQQVACCCMAVLIPGFLFHASQLQGKWGGNQKLKIANINFFNFFNSS